MVVSNLQNYLRNMYIQLKIERMSYLTKDTRVKSLEDIIIKLGLDLDDVYATQEIIKSINDYIQAFHRRLKLPIIEHPRA